MDDGTRRLFERMRREGWTDEQTARFARELDAGGVHEIAESDPRPSAHAGHDDSFPHPGDDLFRGGDLAILQDLPPPRPPYDLCLRSLDELLHRDKLREEDGFPRKIRVGRLVKPGRGGKDKVVVVPTTVEEKLLHDSPLKQRQEGQSGGSGDGEEGEVIGEQPVRQAEGEGTGAGEGSGGQHELDSTAYDLGRILTEQFQLPNLKNKGKKRSLTRYMFDLTDRNRGHGQLLDKKATLRQILETNIALGRIDAHASVDPGDLLISPTDRIYRVLSRERDFESQAMVFFLRDYSGSMMGKATELVVSQHVMIYSWLLYQYDRQVESRFIVHDTEATEVPDLYTYYNSRVAGGTKVASAFRLVNEIVQEENLAADYNIYVFHGTDGDDWDTDGKETVPEIRTMLGYANRVGITVVKHPSAASSRTEVEEYLDESDILVENPDLLRLDAFTEDADESRLIEGIRRLISEQLIAEAEG